MLEGIGEINNHLTTILMPQCQYASFQMSKNSHEGNGCCYIGRI